MMQTKYIIMMKIPTRPDIDYYYVGQNTIDRPGPLFSFKKRLAKRYICVEDAHSDLSQYISHTVHDEILTIESIKCRA